MKMLTKFESKSSCAKSLAFHPKRPWVLVALYNSTIQLWDYRMGTIVSKFEGHDGPVRCVDFHPTQQLFVSSGDDSTVRVWSLQSRKELFTLQGHFDYVRTAFFHKELPWIISASDDQTIRIWNWQNRKQIALLTGHNHWVTCAQFHPTDDLVVSSSLDMYVRVWDISGLRKKHSAPGQFLEQNMAAMIPQPQDQDAFGAPSVMVKYVLEGHERGVNWAAFHPTMPLIVSAGDDRILKLWRYSDSRAWEVDTCRGHTNIVTGCVFHPYQDMIISVGDDKTIRAWDLNHRTLLHTFKREHDKVWSAAFHPSLNLLGAAHNGGSLVFKFERERPPFSVSNNVLYYATQAKIIKSFDPKEPSESKGMLNFKKFGSQFSPLRELSYNAAENFILATSTAENGHSAYLLAKLPPADIVAPIEPSRPFEGPGDQAIFVSRNRFAVLQKESQIVELRDMGNNITKSMSLPITTEYIAQTPIAGHILLLGAKSVILFDIQQQIVVAKIAVRNIKYSMWNSTANYVALMSKHSVTIADRKLVKHSTIHEMVRLKSVAWNDNDVLFFTTFNHLKYSLVNGDVGVLKTLSQTLYVTQVKGNTVYCLARGGSVHIIKVDPTEYRFKRALSMKNFREVSQIINNSNLVGQSIIAYLQKSGYPEIALQFVQDPQTKFDLAIECGDLLSANEQARALGKPVADKILAEAALEQGNHDIVEDIYQKYHNFDKLALLYLLTGNKGRLQKLEQIAQHRGDQNARFQSSIFLGTAESRIQLLLESGLPALAYALAKSNGLTDLANKILAESGLKPSQINVPIQDISRDPIPGISFELYKQNWPVNPPSSTGFLLEANSAGPDANEAETIDESETGVADKFDDDVDAAAEDFNDIKLAEDDEADGAWDLDVEDFGDELAAEAEVASQSVSETASWVTSSQIAADHIAAGSFETAAQLLNRQVGVQNFAPLKARFMQIYKAARVHMTAVEGLPPLPFYLTRENGSLPSIPGFDSLSGQLQEAYRLVKGNKLELAIETFREVLYTCMLIAVTPKDAEEVKNVISICRNYILAFSIELKRRSLPASDVKRNLELAAYFTKPKLRTAHAAIPLQVALMQAHNARNFSLASYFADEYLRIVKTGPSAEKVKKLKARADANPLDSVEIEFNRVEDFDVCPSTLTPVYAGQPQVREPLTGAIYHASEKGKIDVITGVTVVGAPTSGLKIC